MREEKVYFSTAVKLISKVIIKILKASSYFTEEAEPELVGNLAHKPKMLIVFVSLNIMYSQYLR